MKTIPDSWLYQKLEFEAINNIGLVQYQNGPCGILSVIQAVIIRNLIGKYNDFEPINNKIIINDSDIAEAI